MYRRILATELRLIGDIIETWFGPSFSKLGL
jgi:hypothetical protein